jgi:peptide chain release factor 1
MAEELLLFLRRAEECRDKYKKVIQSLQDPEVIKDRKKIIELSQQKKTLENIILPFDEFNEVSLKIKEDEKILSETEDEEMVTLAEEEIRDLENRKEQLVNKIRNALMPEDLEDKKNAVLEIRAGTGGEEAALFAADLLRMYARYAESQGWKFEVVDFSKSGMNGYKEVISLISGGNVYGNMKFESGVHRVQRIPVTESGGRIHTSAVTVAVLPEREEIEVEINPEDLDIDFYSASAPGGQHVNRASSAVRIEHKPSGIIVSCQDERSQHQNREKAMRLLRAKLFEYEQEKADREVKSKRKKIVGTGDRSEKIRTYNFPQNRITDHRINYTKYNLDSFLDGKIADLVENLRASQKEESHNEIT